MSDPEFPLWRGGARVTDPTTSKQAAKEVRADGTVAQSKILALKAVADYPGHTARELANMVGVHSIHRRLTELDRSGQVNRDTPRRCSITGRRAATWRPTV